MLLNQKNTPLFHIVFLLLLTHISILTHAQSQPTLSNMRYGQYERQVLDLYMANGIYPAPVAIFIHGGGFKSGDKSQVHAAGQLLDELLDAGISVAAINYRFTTDDDISLNDVFEQDMALAVQTLRARAQQLGLDRDRFAAFGNSAGAGAAMWLGVHDDQVDPLHPDPIRRESSKVQVVGHLAGQATYDTLQWAGLVQVDSNWAEIINFEDDLFWYSIDIRRQINWPAASAIREKVDLMAMMDSGDAPMFIENFTASTPINLTPPLTDAEKNTAKIQISHDPKHAIWLGLTCGAVGLECSVNTETTPLYRREQMLDFFRTYLLN